MIGAQRQDRVLTMIRAYGTGNVAELARELGVSQSTVRRDLSELSGRGLLTRVHGGASLGGSQVEGRRAARGLQASDAKRRIGAAAAELIEDGSTLLLSGGTTTEAMLPFLAQRRRLTVLTNSLPVASALVDLPEISVVVLGGLLRHSEMSLLGPLAETALSEFRVDGAVCGAFGVHPDSGIYGADLHEVSTDRRLLATTDQLLVLADSSKFRQRGSARLAPVEAISTLVTDTDAPAQDVERLRGHGVDVVLC